MKAIKVRAKDNHIEIVDVPEEFDSDWIAKQIECEWIEMIHPMRLRRGYVMIGDEVAKSKPNYRNLMGSILYKTDEHGEPIMGNIMIMKEIRNDWGEIDIMGMNDDEACAMLTELLKIALEVI